MKYLFLLLCLTSCATSINPPCSYWVINIETKYPLFVESRAIPINTIEELSQLMNECKVVSVIKVDNNFYAITQ